MGVTKKNDERNRNACVVPHVKLNDAFSIRGHAVPKTVSRTDQSSAFRPTTDFTFDS